ncbi:hypothetical protein LB565_26435 [Mesorhizobium sp. CA14]|uniref:hypothetical protein n=1 Tax=Mesorhizobium sp. CA14 TaxID=2876642 RepID=UPI001CC9F0B0|nr:hypothetical protein [Mesorhizobium sp. CA14]MBZ9851533.1 hypothetical protein [Mesorhizobium sp. CA14]
MRGGAAVEDQRAGLAKTVAGKDNLAASALPLIAMPGISPRIVTGKGARDRFRQTKKAAPKRRLID